MISFQKFPKILKTHILKNQKNNQTYFEKLKFFPDNNFELLCRGIWLN